MEGRPLNAVCITLICWSSLIDSMNIIIIKLSIGKSGLPPQETLFSFCGGGADGQEHFIIGSAVAIEGRKVVMVSDAWAGGQKERGRERWAVEKAICGVTNVISPSLSHPAPCPKYSSIEMNPSWSLSFSLNRVDASSRVMFTPCDGVKDILTSTAVVFLSLRSVRESFPGK